MPMQVDVAIVGGGYTGMAAARALALRRLAVVVLERETLGWGASSRNGGFVLPGFKVDAEVLVRRYGAERARRLWDFSLEALSFVERLVREESIDCDLRKTGWVSLAAKPGHMKALEASSRLLADLFQHPTTVLDREALAGEIGSARYFGGVLDPAALALHPLRYFNGLAAAAIRAGAGAMEHCAVERIEYASGGFTLQTSRGPLNARNVLVATNGYGGRLERPLAARVVPVGSYIVATAPLSEDLAARLVPRGRVMSDTKNLLYYFRVWDRRLVFGGRASFAPDADAASRAILARGIAEVYPELAQVKLEHSWGGTLGFAVDHMPHAGIFSGVHHAVAYAGHGVALASYLGHRMGELIAGGGAPPPVWGLPFRRIPFYSGDPWFLPLAAAYYRAMDWLT